MNVGDVQGFLRQLGVLLKVNQGGKPAAEFEAFCGGLEPFKDQPVGAFAQFLHLAEEYKRTGVVPVPTGKRAARKPAAPKAPKAPKVALKKKDDVQAVDEAAARLKGLYDRATDPALTHEAIEQEVGRIEREFDGEGLKEVARKFGISSGLTGKAAAKKKILDRIAERKGRHERGEVIAEVARATAPAPPPAVPALTEAEVVVAEEVPAGPQATAEAERPVSSP
jgi:hypothetical protein